MGRRTSIVVAITLVGSLVLPAAATAVDAGVDVTDGPERADLDAARTERSDAARELSDVERSVRRTNDEVAALDVSLTAASTELAQVTDELADAREAHREARTAERAAADELAAVGLELDGTVTQMRDHRDRLADRLVHTFKHGSAAPQDMLVRGVAGAGDWHEVAITLETVGRMADDDHALIARSVELTRDTATLHTDVRTVRIAAIETARAAAVEEQHVERLVAQQERVVAAVDRDRDERARVLASFEADASARAVLVADLDRRVEQLEAEEAARIAAAAAREAAAREAAAREAAAREAAAAAAREAAEAEREGSSTDAVVPVVDDLDATGPAPPWAAGLPGRGPTWAAAIEATAARHGIDGRLLAALVWTESNFDPNAVSHAGALGLTQLMPGTARGLGVDPRDPLQNLDGGARYLRAQLDTFGRADLALAAYNAGPARVSRANGVPNIVETQLYVVRVLDRYEQLKRVGG